MDRKWSKPRLIVLERGTREESVLLACKGDAVTQGPGVQGASCKNKHNVGCISVVPS